MIDGITGCSLQFFKLMKKSPAFNKSDPIILSLIVILAFYLRSRHLDAAAMWIDEAFRFSHSSQPLRGMFLQYAADNHPPLYGLVLHFWMARCDSLLWLRFLSVIFSAFSLPVLWLLYRAFLPGRQAMFAVFLTAVAPFHISMAQEMNYPSMMFFLSSIALLGAVYFSARPELRYLVVYIVFSIAALLTHYNAAFLVFSINAALVIYFLAERAWKPMWIWLGGQVALTVAGLTLAGSLPSQAQRVLGLLPAENILAHLRSLPVGGIPRVYEALLLGVHFEPKGAANITMLAAMLLIAVAGAALTWRVMRRSEKLIVFVIIFLTPVVGFGMMLATGLYFSPKYYFYLLPLLLVMLLRGWGSIGSATARRVVFAAVALIFLVSAARYYNRLEVPEDNATVITYIEENFSDGDLLLVNPPYLSLLFDFYAPGKLFPLGIPDNFHRKKPYRDIRHVTDGDLKSLKENAGRFERVWVFYGLGTKTRVDPDGRMARLFEDDCGIEEKRAFSVAPFDYQSGSLFVFKNCR
ncbi:MAG: glycosyltransferase family 39 protein [bacterium]